MFHLLDVAGMLTEAIEHNNSFRRGAWQFSVCYHLRLQRRKSERQVSFE
jgi:hypothetical protein